MSAPLPPYTQRSAPECSCWSSKSDSKLLFPGQPSLTVTACYPFWGPASCILVVTAATEGLSLRRLFWLSWIWSVYIWARVIFKVFINNYHYSNINQNMCQCINKKHFRSIPCCSLTKTICQVMEVVLQATHQTTSIHFLIFKNCWCNLLFDAAVTS